MSMWRYGAFLCLALSSTLARAQSAPAANSPTARSHFDEGLAQAARGDLLAALHEFEAAYNLQPHYSVLYNIGQARAALGRPVEAIAAFKQYLAEGADKITAARRDEVNGLLEANRKRVGQLRLANDTVAGAHIWVDGLEIAADRLQSELPLAAGVHSLLHTVPGCSPVSQQVVVVAGDTLVPVLVPAKECRKPPGLLEIDCKVPQVEVNVAGIAKTTTPVAAPLPVPAGEVTVRFSRPGYGNIARSVHVNSAELTRVPCDQHAISPLPVTLAARLLVRKTPADATVIVDGAPFDGNLLPAGTHQVAVEHHGYVSMARAVWLKGGGATSIEATLTPTANTAARARASRSRNKWLGVGLGGTALGLWGTAGAVYSWNSNRYDNWQARSATQPTSGDLKTAASVQRVDDLSLALAVLGAGLAIGGTWLFFEGE